MTASASIPVSGDRDVGGGEGLSLCLWYILSLCCPEAAGQVCLFLWVSDVQIQEAAWQRPGYTRTRSRTGPLQDPRGTSVFLVPEATLQYKIKHAEVSLLQQRLNASSYNRLVTSQVFLVAKSQCSFMKTSPNKINKVRNTIRTNHFTQQCLTCTLCITIFGSCLPSLPAKLINSCQLPHAFVYQLKERK